MWDFFTRGLWDWTMAWGLIFPFIAVVGLLLLKLNNYMWRKHMPTRQWIARHLDI